MRTIFCPMPATTRTDGAPHVSTLRVDELLELGRELGVGAAAGQGGEHGALACRQLLLGIGLGLAHVEIRKDHATPANLGGDVEELFAAGAYLSGDPRLVGSLKGADLIKIVIILLIVVAGVLETAGNHGLTQWLATH